LLDHFIKHFSARHGRRVTGITPRALQAVLNHSWPGNIRELENVIERGIILADDHEETLDLRHLLSIGAPLDNNPSLMRLTGLGTLHLVKSENLIQDEAHNIVASRTMPLEHWARGAMGKQGMTLAAVEEALVSAALDETNGNISRAAELLGVTRAQVSYRVKRGQKSRKGLSA
jgi:DNA-binding NtrC family response regulator